MIPFPLLRKLAAHEHQFLAGVAEHEGIVGAKIGEALPVISGHTADERTLAVHNFVMRQGQNEIFRERILQTKQDIAVMVVAMDRILADVIQRVVHPAHIPFIAEPQPAEFDGTRNLGPGSRLFRRGSGLRKTPKDFGIEARIAGKVTKGEKPQVSIVSKLTAGKEIIYS